LAVAGDALVGVSPETAFDIEKRPFYATEDGKGRASRALFRQGMTPVGRA